MSEKAKPSITVPVKELTAGMIADTLRIPRGEEFVINFTFPDPRSPEGYHAKHITQRVQEHEDGSSIILFQDHHIALNVPDGRADDPKNTRGSFHRTYGKIPLISAEDLEITNDVAVLGGGKVLFVSNQSSEGVIKWKTLLQNGLITYEFSRRADHAEPTLQEAARLASQTPPISK